MVVTWLIVAFLPSVKWHYNTSGIIRSRMKLKPFSECIFNVRIRVRCFGWVLQQNACRSIFHGDESSKRLCMRVLYN